MFEDIRRERSLIVIQSLKDERILKQSRFTDHEFIEKKTCFRKNIWPKISKRYVAVQRKE